MAQKTLDQHFTEFEQSLKDLGRFHYEFVKSQFEELRTVVGDKMTLEELAAEYHQSDNVELKEKLAAKDQEIACLRAENEQLREELSGSSRRPICVNCWLSGNQCDLEGPCTSCGDRGLYCERKECGNPRSCAGSRCPRVHWQEYVDEQRTWNVGKGRLPPMDHRSGGRRVLVDLAGDMGDVSMDDRR